MEKITAIIPTYNESHNIDAVLKSVDFADEIMVVDSFSTDDTVEKAKKHTDFIVQREYGYSASQKNWAIPQATHNWILLVDADERVTPELKEEIIQYLNNPILNEYAGFWIYRKNFFMGKPIKHGGFRNDKVIRLFQKEKCKYQDKQVHAEIETSGKVGFLKNKLEHNTYISFDHHIEKLNRYAWYQANDFNQTTGTLTPYHFVIKPAWRFFKHYIVQGGFRDGFVGLTLAFFQYYAVFTRYVKIWLLRKNIK